LKLIGVRVYRAVVQRGEDVIAPGFGAGVEVEGLRLGGEAEGEFLRNRRGEGERPACFARGIFEGSRGEGGCG
jgi:hypothetical protein